MEFYEAVRARRSVRRYTDEPVPPEVMARALDAALLAPNSSNMQPWEFHWVRSPELRAKLAEACLSQPAAATAKELVVAVARADTWRRNAALMLDTIGKDGGMFRDGITDYYKKVVPLAYIQGPFSILGALKKAAVTIAGLFRAVPRGPCSHAELRLVLSKTVALACENFMLAVAAEGFGTCPMEGFDEVRVKKLLRLPRRSRVVMVIGAGRPAASGIYGERIRHDRGLFIFEH